MSDTVIKVENLSKQYRIGEHQGYKTFREAIVDAAKAPVNALRSLIPTALRSKLIAPSSKLSSPNDTIWALKDVSFEVKRGEVVGIIGRNGAGKSTLLKIISKIAEPTSGRIELRGRVGSLLEIGSGFHPELTGHENIYLYGAILGMDRWEVTRKFDEIVAFSELKKFIDTPVKRYSSGMYMRLAFAVAAYMDSDILLVDEVLAVGDAEFQKKCLGKMKDVSRKGRTVLFVSHQMDAIANLTHRCLVLNHGDCIFDGATDESIERYIGTMEHFPETYKALPREDYPVITGVSLKTTIAPNIQVHAEPMDVRIDLYAPNRLENPAVSFSILNSFGLPVLYGWCFHSEQSFGERPGMWRLVCHIPKLRLYQGRYILAVRFSERLAKKNNLVIENICPFEVVMHGKTHDFGWAPGACTYIEDFNWKICQKD
ncbi:MAG: ABC transporter ATP-binding protein [Desulfobacterales bacterium]|nr:ABC transporter ATP-binding protein [Desulfobacterales bacterium]